MAKQLLLYYSQVKYLKLRHNLIFGSVAFISTELKKQNKIKTPTQKPKQSPPLRKKADSTINIIFTY